MTKYLFCILVSVILVLSVCHAQKELSHLQAGEAFHKEVCIESGSQSSFHCSRNIFHVVFPAFSKEAITGCKVLGGVFSRVSFSAERTPLKVSKFTTSAVWRSTLLNMVVSWNKISGIYKEDRCAGKFSYRYYVYTLKRILI